MTTSPIVPVDSAWLEPTWFIDSDSAAVTEVASCAVGL